MILADLTRHYCVWGSRAVPWGLPSGKIIGDVGFQHALPYVSQAYFLLPSEINMHAQVSRGFMGEPEEMSLRNIPTEVDTRASLLVWRVGCSLWAFPAPCTTCCEGFIEQDNHFNSLDEDYKHSVVYMALKLHVTPPQIMPWWVLILHILYTVYTSRFLVKIANANFI